MISSLARLNAMTPDEAVGNFMNCCGSFKWAVAMADARPFPSDEQLYETADNVWRKLSKADWLEAFRHHPPIGEMISENIGEKPAEESTAKTIANARSAAAQRWACDEQAATRDAAQHTLKALACANRDYLERFGTIFIVCATGKSTDQMLALLRQRLQNDPETELAIAAEEQRRITRLRLEKLLRGE